MFKSTPVSILLLVASSMVSADLLVITPRTPEPQLTLEKRTCTTTNVCYSTDNEYVCATASEICCQLPSGTSPYTCPSDYPYCCPTTSGSQLCGTTASCTGPIQDGPSDSSSSNPKKSLGHTMFHGKGEGWNAIGMLALAAAAAL
jgi:hypothetical protein